MTRKSAVSQMFETEIGKSIFEKFSRILENYDGAVANILPQFEVSSKSQVIKANGRQKEIRVISKKDFFHVCKAIHDFLADEDSPPEGLFT